MGGPPDPLIPLKLARGRNLAHRHDRDRRLPGHALRSFYILTSYLHP
jgi:hypothetical protein